MDAFWETMEKAWEKLDKHRISKYLLFTRIIIAEAFKCLRVARWPAERLKALGETITRGMSQSLKTGQNVHSLGFIMQFVRIFWSELLPQVEQSKPVADPAVLMSLLEPFCVLAQQSPIRNLVQRIHEHILRKAPRSLADPLAKRLLELAGEEDLYKSNREALYETADELEKELRKPSPSMVAALTAVAKKKGGGALSPLVLPKAASKAAKAGKSTTDASVPKAAKRKTKTVARKKKSSDEGGLSPLLLPKAALPIVSDTKKKAAKKKQETSSSVDAGPAKKKIKKKQT